MATVQKVYTKVLLEGFRYLVSASKHGAAEGGPRELPKTVPAREIPPPSCLTESPAKSETAIAKPGCTAADESFLAYMHLSGLAKGWGGFGVLRETKKHLEKAQQGAVLSEDQELANRFGVLAKKLPAIHDQATAKEAVDELEPLLPRAWGLGRRCGISSHVIQKASDLSSQVRDGKLTRDEAVKQLKAYAEKETPPHG